MLTLFFVSSDATTYRASSYVIFGPLFAYQYAHFIVFFSFLRLGVVLAYYCTHRPRHQLGRESAVGPLDIVLDAFESDHDERLALEWTDRLPVDDDDTVHGHAGDREHVQAERPGGGDVQDGTAKRSGQHHQRLMFAFSSRPFLSVMLSILGSFFFGTHTPLSLASLGKTVGETEVFFCWAQEVPVRSRLICQLECKG